MGEGSSSLDFIHKLLETSKRGLELKHFNFSLNGMDIIIPHYPNDSEQLQIESISPQAEYEPQAVRRLTPEIAEQNLNPLEPESSNQSADLKLRSLDWTVRLQYLL